MNEMHNSYIRNQILTMPMQLNQELSYMEKNFNKRSDYDVIVRYIDDFLEGKNIKRKINIA